MEIPQKVKLIIYSTLTPELELLKRKFGSENFTIDEIGDPEWEEEIKEWFWKSPDKYVFAYVDEELVGMASLFLREVPFNGEVIKLAGLGGLTVSKSHRGEGIARKLIEERLRISREWGADIAFLNTDVDKLGGLFSKFGFIPLGKNYSFVGKSGQTHRDDSGMIAPLLSEDIFKSILKSQEQFFVGEGNM